MSHTVELPNCSVAIKNVGAISLTRMYAQKAFNYPKQVPGEAPKITTVPMFIAHHHFGFEITPQGHLYRNRDDRYDDGDETAYYVARANLLPWGWINDEKVYNPRAPKDKQITRAEYFELIKETFEFGIEGRLLSLPAEISPAQWDSLEPALETTPV